MKQLGSRTGNWLTSDRAKLLLEKADGEDLRSLRDLAMISVLLGCGLRRAEQSALAVGDMQIRQEHWAIVDLVGKGSHIRTVPVPNWVKVGLHLPRDAQSSPRKSLASLVEHQTTKSGLWGLVCNLHGLMR